jgi:hypothetical protein
MRGQNKKRMNFNKEGVKQLEVKGKKTESRNKAHKENRKGLWRVKYW